MRWERLFDEIEQQSIDLAAMERDALAADLESERWQQTSWRDLVGGLVELDVEGVGVLQGRVRNVAELIEIESDGRITWIDPVRVVAATIANRKRGTIGTDSWRSQLRQASGLKVRVWSYTGASRAGSLVTIGNDFVQLASEPNRRDLVIPRSSMSAVTVTEFRA